MNQYINELTWNDNNIPHRLWVEECESDGTRLCLKVIKDVEPEILYLDLPVNQQQVMGAWQGKASPISDEFNDGKLYSQVRSLLNLPQGCVVWTVNHIQMPSGLKMSADKLAFIPEMKQEHGLLVAI
ncbi:hypothetical protein [Photobacterium indicum]|jgi:hypothetical protein|uniref:Uncharacterized protein n=1 Tax=Photobacterium indicum TaxID=81447 RepID=A0A2T3LCF3_9GAMM|nr:hypothetical protein [Photobacterium indicum]PSV49047.1 hypothetical protein C9J47_00260 [Photobacterium indicum]